MNENRNKEFAKNTAILSFGKLCTQCISFFLLPLYTSILEPSEYGVIDLLTTYNSLLLIVAGAMLDQGMFRFLIDSRKNKERNIEIFSSITSVSFVQAIVYIIVFLLISPYITLKYKYFLAIDVVMSIFLQLFMQYARGLGKNTDYAISSFISATGTVLFNVLFLVAFHFDGRGLLYSVLISKGLSIIYLYFKEKVYLNYRVHKSKIKIVCEICRFSLPLVPNNLAWWVVNASDRTIINSTLGTTLNGIYSVANKFSNVFINIFSIVNLSWTETVSLHYSDEDRDTFLSVMMTTLYNLFSATCIGIIGFVPIFFNLLVDERYSDAYLHIPILMIAMLFRVFVGLYSAVYVAEKKTLSIMSTTIVAAIINLGINLFFIKSIGLYAASGSTLIAFLVVAIYRYIDITRRVKLKIESSSLFLSCFFLVIVGVMYYFIDRSLAWLNLIASVLFALILNRNIISDIPRLLKKITR